MCFGLPHDPGIFQELMSIVLHGLGDFSMAYMEDIIIFSIAHTTQIKIKIVKI